MSTSTQYLCNNFFFVSDHCAKRMSTCTFIQNHSGNKNRSNNDTHVASTCDYNLNNDGPILSMRD